MIVEFESEATQFDDFNESQKFSFCFRFVIERLLGTHFQIQM